MIREVRKVPAHWQHPSDGCHSDGQIRYEPLFDSRHFESKAAQWDKSAAEWAAGEFPEDANATHRAKTFEQWDGPRPNPTHYMPLWPEAERTHFMMYELTTEGTPISPAFETKEALATWLVENEATLYADETASYDLWMKICNAGSVTDEIKRQASGN
jgi:hypothetical protein